MPSKPLFSATVGRSKSGSFSTCAAKRTKRTPSLPPEVAIQRQRLMIEMVLTSLALWTRRPDAMVNESARRFFVEGLFDSVHGALSAPVSAETLAALKAAAKG